MALSDVFVFFDDVQYDRRGWRNRNRIKSTNGPVWLTVPVVQKGKFDQELLDTMIDQSQNWANKHLRTIEFNYRIAPHFPNYFPEIQVVMSNGHEKLIDLDLALIEAHRQWLGLQSIRTIRSSELNIRNQDKTGRLIDICREIGIDEYISGPLCQDYLDIDLFLKSGIRVLLHHYSHPVYPQKNGDFIPYLATIDLLMNMGPQSLDVLKDETALVDYLDNRSSD